MVVRADRVRAEPRGGAPYTPSMREVRHVSRQLRPSERLLVAAVVHEGTRPGLLLLSDARLVIAMRRRPLVSVPRAAIGGVECIGDGATVTFWNGTSHTYRFDIRSQADALTLALQEAKVDARV
jgi:hypothetical protein